MSFLRRLLGLEEANDEDVAASEATADHDTPAGMRFEALFRDLGSESERAREDAALVISGLAPPAAVGPLTRAYARHGDRFLLDALGGYGDRLTRVAARQASDLSRSPRQRARLMAVLGVAGDPRAVAVLERATREHEPEVRVAAAKALVELEQPRGLDALAESLLSHDETLRTRALLALDELRTLEEPAVDEAIESHVRRYLAEGGAVPASIRVSMPLLVDAEVDLAALAAERVRASRHTLTLVIGPVAAQLAEHQRPTLVATLPDDRLFFTTDRHTVPEQLDVLERARARAAAGRRTALIGPLPSPRATHPLPHVLVAPERGPSYSAQVVYLGPADFGVVMEWWYYITDRAEVPSELAVVVTGLTLGGAEMTDEERAIYRLAGAERADAFARAWLARRRALG